MLNTTELLKRKSSQVSTDTDTELSPSSVQLKKKWPIQKYVLHSVSHSTGTLNTINTSHTFDT